MRPRDELVSVDVGGVELKMSRSFFRGADTTFRPVAATMQEPGALAEHLLAGLMPPEPFIDAESTIVAFGSCFAQHVSGYLNHLGFDVASNRRGRAYITEMGDGIVNTFAIRQQFEWAWQGRIPPVPLWHGYSGAEFGYDEEARQATQDLFDRADVFIITLGLSEIWYDEPTGEVFWRAVPQEAYDAERHKFRTATVAENKANLHAVCNLIQQRRPDSRTIFTVSPVPMSATFRPVSAISASTASKASLRAAVDEVLQERGDTQRLFYHPSYEVVLECFRHPFQDDNRHPFAHVLELNMRAFERYFCRTGLEDADLEAAYLTALAADRAAGLLDDKQKSLHYERERLWREANPAASLRQDLAAQAQDARIAARQEERAQRVALREARRARRQGRD